MADKIEKISDRIYMCRSGTSSHTQKIGNIVRAQLEQFRYNFILFLISRTIYGCELLVRNAATLAKNIVYANKDILSAGIIMAGIDDVEGPSIYEVSSGGSLIKQQFCLGGSGSIFIYGYVDSNYNPDMTPEEGEDFVRKGMFLRMERIYDSMFLIIAQILMFSNSTCHLT